jgi:hypothetical protein
MLPSLVVKAREFIAQSIIQTGGTAMWLLSLISLGLGGYALITLGIFGLVSAGRKADEGEKRILELISPAAHNDTKKDAPVQTSEAAVAQV